MHQDRSSDQNRSRLRRQIRKDVCEILCEISRFPNPRCNFVNSNKILFLNQCFYYVTQQTIVKISESHIRVLQYEKNSKPEYRFYACNLDFWHILMESKVQLVPFYGSSFLQKSKWSTIKNISPARSKGTRIWNKKIQTSVCTRSFFSLVLFFLPAAKPSGPRTGRVVVLGGGGTSLLLLNFLANFSFMNSLWGGIPPRFRLLHSCFINTLRGGIHTNQPSFLLPVLHFEGGIQVVYCTLVSKLEILSRPQVFEQSLLLFLLPRPSQSSQCKS